jgi:hypothetical protein
LARFSLAAEHRHPTTYNINQAMRFATKMPGLSDSRWASGQSNFKAWPQSIPVVPQPQTQHTRTYTPNAPTSELALTPSPEKELARYLKIVARLQWKFPFLAEGFRVATDRLGRPPEMVAANEIHFKIDFYEYYMHIERALVHLMSVFGIKVTGLADSVHNPTNYESGKPRQSRGGRMAVVSLPSQHRYHANVLSALDRPDNPLREILGQGEVQKQLVRAKELRNRWKNVDELANEREYTPAPLEAYNLDVILQTIFQGLDRAYQVAEAYVQSINGATRADGTASMNWQQEEEDWEFMVDAMDWEAV